MIRSMQRRLAVVVLLFLVAVYACLCAVSYGAAVSGMVRESERMLRSLAEPEPPAGDLGFPGQVGVPYFTLVLDSRGVVMTADQGQFDISDEELLGLAAQVLTAEEDSGYLGSYHLRYYRLSTPGGWRLVFADDSLQEEVRLRQGAKQPAAGPGPVAGVSGLLLASGGIDRPARAPGLGAAGPIRGRRLPRAEDAFDGDPLQHGDDPGGLPPGGPGAPAPGGIHPPGGGQDAGTGAGYAGAGPLRRPGPLPAGAGGRWISAPMVATETLAFEAVAYEAGLALTTEAAEGVVVRADGKQAAQGAPHSCWTTR